MQAAGRECRRRGCPNTGCRAGFRKSLELFNQHRAASEDSCEPLVVVEGFFGCMRVWQAGHRRVVSLMGSMLSEAQEERIVELAGPEVRCCCCSTKTEPAGKAGPRRWNGLSNRVSVSVIRLEDGQQPDSLGPEELLRLIEQHAEEEVAA